ncbi:MAG: DMT family transporter [Actinobacteria bacterium]|nr:DMT family transporter [Actinomycetota bacterium]
MSARHLGLLLLGVVAISFAAILVRLADAPPLAVAFYRNAIAAAILVPLAVARHRRELLSLRRRDVALAVLAGALLAAHFASWIPSITLTTIAASTVLVETQPVWVGLAGHFFLGERLHRRAGLGIAVALGGAAVVAGGDVGLSGDAMLGDLLALGGAVAGAGYYLAGRDLRRRLSVLAYVAIAYSSCAAVLMVAMVGAGTPFLEFPAGTWMAFLAMALVPHILGHTVLNYLLGFLEATVIAVAVMAEPVGATILALAFFGEVPSWSALVGGPLVLMGIYVAIRAQGRRVAPAPVD